MSRLGSNYEIVMEQGVELVNFYRKYPVIAAHDLLGVKMAPIQRLVFNDMWTKSYIISIMSRGAGKTYLLGTLAALSCMLYPGYRVGLIGPSFRQSKNIFAEVEKLYYGSSILREACEKKPTRASDSCYLKFKAVGGAAGSFIEAIPLGDGNKIRGSRFYMVLVDEAAQVEDKTLDIVIRPFGATVLNPMENVERIERQNRLINMGLAVASDFVEEKVNKMILTSSGYYKFNHLWRRMKSYWKHMDNNPNAKYAVHQVPYTFLPEGFLDKSNIESAQNDMSEYEFRMEYGAEMISDSEGFFKASLLETCSINSGFTVEAFGAPEAQYIVGVDPNQGGEANCGIVVIRLGDSNKIVNILDLENKTTQELTTEIQNICENYNVARIYMDKAGGGKALKDLLEEGYNGKKPILDREDETNINKDGLRILDMITFNPSWISDANFTTLSFLENRKLLFPESPRLTELNRKFGIQDEQREAIYNRVERLKQQMLKIIVTQTASGLLHFDTPKKGQNKDLYSALILASYGVKLYTKELEEGVCSSALYNVGGLIRSHTPNASWDTLRASEASENLIGAAVLKRISK